MKLIPARLKPSRKVVILVAAAVLLSGASGAAAVFVGREAILGPPAEKVSGVACVQVNKVKLDRNGQRWIRYYARAQAEDGDVRVKTALRIAGALSNHDEADLYQVVLLDQAGPANRADMRGRAIGAEVLFARNPSAIPGMTAPFVASYTEGKPSASGEFYGEKKQLSLDEIKTIVTAITERDGCVDPAAAEGEAHGPKGETPSESHAASDAPAEEAAGEQAHAAADTGH